MLAFDLTQYEPLAANDNASPFGLCATSNVAHAANALNQVANVPNRTALAQSEPQKVVDFLEQVSAKPRMSDAGNMQSDGRGNTFVHDGNNRLTKATKADGNVLNFRYDGDGLRMETVKNSTGTTPNLQFAGGVHTRYVTSATEELADLDGTRAVLRRYVAGPAIDERIAQVDARFRGGFGDRLSIA